MFRFIQTIFLIITICISIPVHAEFYRYKDSNGVILFTDDLSQVPKDQRSDIDVFESGTSFDPDETIQKSPPKADSQIDVLEQQKEWLITEQNALNLESDALMALEKSINTPDAQENYNNKVRALNKRIDTYKEKLARFKTIAK